MERLETAEKTNPITSIAQNTNLWTPYKETRKPKKQRKIGSRLKLEVKLPVLGADFSDHSRLTRADTTFETTEVTISAKTSKCKATFKQKC